MELHISVTSDVVFSVDVRLLAAAELTIVLCILVFVISTHRNRFHKLVRQGKACT